MKNFILLAFLFCVSFPLDAYEAGTVNRTNFSGGQNHQRGNYRSFSNYNNRTWGQGVETTTVQVEPVQTSLAGSADKPAAPVAKKQAVAAAPAAKPMPTNASTAPVAQAALPAAAKAGEMPADAAAVMQQMQGMMNMVNNMSGGQGGMPAGMPDMSALMGGAMAKPQGTAPKK